MKFKLPPDAAKIAIPVKHKHLIVKKEVACSVIIYMESKHALSLRSVQIKMATYLLEMF